MEEKQKRHLINRPLVYKILKENLPPLGLENCQPVAVINCSSRWNENRVDQTLKQTNQTWVADFDNSTAQSSQIRKNRSKT